MRLRKEPKTIPEALLQYSLITLESVTCDEALVKIGGGRYPGRWIHFHLYYECPEIPMKVYTISFKGPRVSNFLFGQAETLAFMNIRYEKEKKSS